MTILQLQCLLTFLGYALGAIDGIFGEQTKAAVCAFQSDYGLNADGDPGVQTQKALRGAVAGMMEPVTQKSSESEDSLETGTFWDEIKYFTRAEFACKCGGKYCNGYPEEMQENVVKIADAAREHFGKPAHVVSGLRCKQWNAIQGGVVNSQHMYGEAIDLRIEGVSAAQLQTFVSAQPHHRYSYCINDTNVHFDIPAAGR